ncbi:hypothetical protein [Fusobacterium ulcerans]|uniref:hypothetical protein n=1 Tax=Fusobacterium ulcerans TaxID=861 RepID=UPI001D0AEB5F|nr:hypothetical protein [Fusobacterium ulcerans]MCB8566329.1 hypothetical protein [Fusobacterium ulcerans]MCB8650368.1 hypothetical protein [Fusobacterium ulcerans]
MGNLKKRILLSLMLCNFCFNTAVMGEIIPASVLMEEEQRNANNEVRTGKSIFYHNGNTVRIEKRKLDEKNKPDDTEREDKETGKPVEKGESESSENNNQGKAAADMGEQKTKES